MNDITEMSFIFLMTEMSFYYSMSRRDILLEKIENYEKKYIDHKKINMENNELLTAKYKIISKLIRQGYI